MHLNLFRCRLGVGISIRIDLNINSNIGIKVKNLYQLMNKCHRILCFWQWHFLFGSLQLKAIWSSTRSSTTKVTKPLRFVVFLSSKLIRIFSFKLTQIYPSFSRSKSYFLMNLNFRKSWMNNRR